MVEWNSIEHDFNKTPNIYLSLNATASNDQQLKLNKIDQIKDYLLAEIRERELIRNNFEYFSKSLFFLYVVPVVFMLLHLQLLLGHLQEYLGRLCSYIFSYIRICKKDFKSTRNKKRKHKKIVMLAS